MKLRAISTFDPDGATELAVRSFEKRAPVILDAEFRNSKLDLERKETKTAGTGGATITRLINTDNTAISYTPAYRNITKMIISRDVQVDKIVEKRGEDPISKLAEKTTDEMDLVARYFQAMFVTGDSGAVATDFDGLENIIAQGRTVTGGMIVPVGGDSVADQQQLAIEKLLQHAQNVETFGPDQLVHAYLNGQLKVRWLTVAKKLGYYSQVQRPDSGAVDEIVGNKIVLRDVGLDVNGNNFLPFTETGSASSIWFVGWDENGQGVHFLTSGGMIGEYNGKVGNFYRNNFNMDCALGCRNSNALVRSTGWKVS